MPRVVITVRRTMIAVAIVAVLLATGMAARRWWTYRARAQYHANQAWGAMQESANSFELAYDDVRSAPGSTRSASVDEAYEWRKLALYHNTLWRKYESAMGRPWLPVAPDPPPP